jgi:hypothetical protein
MDRELKMYRNGVETVIAFDENDAAALLLELNSDYVDDPIHNPWELVDINEMIKVNDYDGRGNNWSMPASAWVTVNGRGFLCTTEI